MHAPQLTGPIDLNDDSLAPKLEYFYMTMAGAPVRDGFVAAWSGNDGYLRVAHLDSAGAVTRSKLIAIKLPSQYYRPTLNLMCASDGVEAVVLVSHNGYHVAVHVSESGILTVGEPRSADGFASELVWNGVAYIAHVGQRVWELDRAGQFIAETSVPAFFAAGWDRVVVDGRNVSLLRAGDGVVSRATVTNAEGHVMAPVQTRLPLEVHRSDEIAAAGNDGRGMYVILRRWDYSKNVLVVTFQFLDADGAASGASAVLEGFRDTLRTTRIRDGAVLVMQGGGARTAVVRRRPVIDRPDAFDHDGLDPEQRVTYPTPPAVKTATWSRYRYSADWWNLIPAGDGALLVSPVMVDYDNSPYGVAAVTPLRVNGDEMVLDAPAVLEYSPPVMRYAAATAHGRGFLVLWQQAGLEGSEIWMRYLERHSMSSSRFVSLGMRPKIASQGDVALAVWTRRDSLGSRSLQAIRFGSEGMSIDPVPATTAVESSEVFHVGFDATQFNVILYGTTTARVAFSSPASLEPLTITLDENRIPYNPRAAATAPGNTLLAGGYLASPGGGSTLSAMALRHDLTPHAPPRMISILPGEPRAAWNGDHFAVVWWHIDHFRWARVSSAGEPLDAEYGRVLGELPTFPGNWNNTTFQMVLHGEQFVIAMPGVNWWPFRPALVTVLQPGDQSGERDAVTPIWGADTIEAFVDRPDGTILLVTGYGSARLFVRYVQP